MSIRTDDGANDHPMVFQDVHNEVEDKRTLNGAVALHQTTIHRKRLVQTAIILVLCCTVLLIAGVFYVTIFSIASKKCEQDYVETTSITTFAIGGIEDLVFNLRRADVTVLPNPYGNNMTVVTTARYSDPQYLNNFFLDTNVDGHVMYVDFLFHSALSMLFACPRLFITIYIDSMQLLGLKIINLKGNLTVKNLTLRSIDMITRTGNVLISNLVANNIQFGAVTGTSSIYNSSANSLNMGTETGDCMLQNINASSIKILTSFGNIDVNAIKMSNSSCILTAGTSVGDITISKFLEGSIDLIDSDGDLSMQISANFNGKMNLRGCNVSPLPSNLSVKYTRNERIIKEGDINGGGISYIKAMAEKGQVSLTIF